MVALLKTPRQKDLNAERRLFPRREAHTMIEGCRLDNTLAALRDRRVRLALRDVSLGGLSALSDTPIGAGERLTFSFPAQAAHSGWDAYGRVIRCEQSALGFRVAVEFDPLPAA